MTSVDMILYKAQAVRFFGLLEYNKLKYAAECFFSDNQIPIPSGGVEVMPSYWATVNQLIRDYSENVCPS